MVDIMNFGPLKVEAIGKRLTNHFWREVFCSVKSCGLYSSPEKILINLLWDNPAITRNRKPLKSENFSAISSKIKLVTDIIKPGTICFESKDELEERFDISLDENFYVELKFIVKTAVEELGSRLDKLPILQYPFQPFLVNLALSTKSGCSRYYQLLRKAKEFNKNMLDGRQEKWHDELGNNLSVEFGMVLKS